MLSQPTGIGLIVLLAFAAVGSMLAIGAVHVRTVLVIMPLAVSAGLIVVARQGVAAVRGPAAVLLGLAGYSLLQSLPLPVSLLARLDAATLDVWQGAAQPFGSSLRWASLSLDPGASRVEALKWLGYTGVFLAAAGLTRHRDGRWIPALVFISALLAALTTLVHRLAGADAVFGYYRPLYAVPRFALSPLLNPNNLAGYLNLGAFCGIGCMVARRPIIAPWVTGLGVAVIIAVSAVGGSRAGFISLAAGGIATIFALRFVRFDGRTLPRRVLGGAALAIVGGVGLFLLGADRGAWQSLFEEGMKKLALISWTKSLVAEHFWFGVGRGAFETTFPAYRADLGHHVYQFPENFLMQWCCEWGVPIALAAFGALTWFFRPTRLTGATSPTVLVSGIGVLVLLLHNLLDLGLELASMGILLFIVLGFLWGSRAQKSRDTVSVAASTRLIWAAGGLAASVWLCALMTGRWSAIEDRRTVAAEYRAARRPSAQLTDLRPALQQAMMRHPGDPFLPLIGALIARASGENPLPWLARAIERDPMAGRPHLVLATVLAERGAASQALLSIRLAVDREYGLVKSAADLAASITTDAELLKRTAPTGPGGAGLLTALAVRDELSFSRVNFLQEAAQRDPKAVRPRHLLAQDLLAAMEQGKVPCAASDLASCGARVQRLAASIERLDPHSGAGLVLRARIAAQQGKLLDALQLLEAQCPALTEATDCLRWQVIMAHRLREPPALERAAEAYLGAACARPPACAAAATWLGEQYEKLGDRGRALRLYERAAEEGESGAAWLRVAKLSENLGLPSAAARARSRAKSLGAGEQAPRQDGSTKEQMLRELLSD